jgi:ribonuclease HI
MELLEVILVFSLCAGVFRNHEADVLCCFAEPLGISSSYFAELCGAMRAIELAHQRNYINLWIETDSILVVLAFKNHGKQKVTWSSQMAKCTGAT